ncbi:MAG: archease, partial [Candidatus Kariarchaeaceae archaeon]
FFPKDVEVFVSKEKNLWTLDGTFHGCEFNADIHAIGNDIKAITLHDFYVKQTNQGWESHVIVDV